MVTFANWRERYALSDNGRMDLQRLREETRPEHEATEAAMPLMNPGLTLEAYKDTLRVLLSVLGSWQDWASEQAPPSLRPLLFARRRTHLLLEDLADLAHVPSRFDGFAVPIDWDRVVRGGNNNLPGPTAPVCEAAFLGALYVLEGSTLGGRLIARHLEATFGFRDGKGDAYFRGHGEATGALWREVTVAIAAVPEEQAGLLLGAARRTFEAFRTVLGSLQPFVLPSIAHG